YSAFRFESPCDEPRMVGNSSEDLAARCRTERMPFTAKTSPVLPARRVALAVNSSCCRGLFCFLSFVRFSRKLDLDEWCTAKLARRRSSWRWHISQFCQ